MRLGGCLGLGPRVRPFAVDQIAPAAGKLDLVGQLVLGDGAFLVDGKGAVTFLVRVKEALEDPRRLLMDL